MERRTFIKGAAAAAAVGVGNTLKAAFVQPKGDVFKDLAGTYAPLFTPLRADLSVDEGMVDRSVEWMLRSGMHGFYVSGGTGEGVKMSVAGRKTMLRRTATANKGRGKLIAHVGANRVEDAVELAKFAADCGYEWLAAVRPASIATDYAAMYDYYEKIATATHLPFMIYSCRAPIVPEKDAKFFDIANVRGMKYTGYAYCQVYSLKKLLNKEAIFFIGADEQCLAASVFKSVFSGGIGTTYNIIPKTVLKLYELANAGRFVEAEKYQNRICDLVDLLHGFNRGMAAWKACMKYIGLDQGRCADDAPTFSDAEFAVLSRKLDALGFVERA